MLAETIRLAKNAGKKIILVMNIAGPVELQEYMDDIDALVCIFFPGMEGARALADILFGAISPSGKMPLTFPKTYRQTPTAMNFPGENGQVYYGEGIFVGYRYYDYKDIEPLYPFGFGLSYSEFSIKDAAVSATKYDNASKDPLSVTVTVKNDGQMEAKEVVQLYVHSVNPTLLKPDKELKGTSVRATAASRAFVLASRPRITFSASCRRSHWSVRSSWASSRSSRSP